MSEFEARAFKSQKNQMRHFVDDLQTLWLTLLSNEGMPSYLEYIEGEAKRIKVFLQTVNSSLSHNAE